MASSSRKALRDHFLKHTTKHATKPSLLLKDYLRDDLSSCSSSGFKSFSRRQCCTTVGFHVEKDLRIKRKRRNTLPRRRRNSSSISTVSALQRASEAVINAIKSLPLSQKTKVASGVLSRSFSRKLLSRSFWRKAAKEERSEVVPRRRRSFGQLIMEDKERDKPTSFNEDRDSTVLATAPSFTTSSGCDSNSWGESDFTFASTTASTSSSETSNKVDLVEGTKEGAPRHKIEGVKITDWLNEKDQFSPVLILDCSFEDEEEFHKSHFNSTFSTHSFIEGAKHKHMQKRQHFISVASLEPVVLEKRFAWSELEDEPHNHSTKQSSVSVPTRNENSTNMRHHNMEENARDVLNLVKRSIPSNLIIEAENLLFDYFKQSIEENKEIDHSKKFYLCKVAEDWIRGQPQEVYLGWEVQSGRCVYIREMDKFGEWKTSIQEMQQLVMELGNEVFSDLVNEFILDLATCASN